jgi:hypothetical protein
MPEGLMLSWAGIKGWAHEILGTRSSLSLTTLLFTCLAAWCLYILISGLFFSPTRHIPGPVSARFTDLYFYYRILHGSLGSDLVKLHTKYGILVLLFILERLS